MNAQSNITAGDGDDAFRATHVGASEVAALFGCHPWLTHFELWHRKNGTIDTPDFGGNERVEWGIRLEPAIIEAVKDRYGYTDREQLPRLDNGAGLGGHPDRRVMCPKRGPGILEVKMVDWLERKKWGDEPPVNYLLQNQTYQGLDQCLWGDVIVLVGGNALERFEYDFRPVIYADIEARVATFWESVRDGRPPKPDFARDGDALRSIYDDAADTLIDLRRDNRMADLAGEYLVAKAWQKQADAAVDAAQAEILEKIGNNGAAMVEGYSVKVPTVAGRADAVITPEMVGSVIKGRKPHRRFYIKEI